MPSPELTLKELSNKLATALTNVEAASTRLATVEERIESGLPNDYSPADIKQEIANMSTEIASTTDAITAAKNDINQRLDDFEKLYGAPDFAGGTASKTKVGHLAAEAVQDPEHKSGQPHTARTMAKTRIEFKTWNFENQKTVTDATGSGEDLIIPMYIEDIIGPAERRLTIRNLLPVGQTTTSIIHFTSETAVTDSAGVQAVQGTTKGVSNFVFTRATAEVVTIAHFVKVSTQMLDDVAQLRSYLNTRMRFLLLQEEENQLLLGDGTPGNVAGLVNQATAFDATILTDLAVANVTDIDRLRAAILQVQLAEYAPTGIVMNPFNWAALELRKDGDNRYLFAIPQNTTQPRIWGLPVISTTAMTQGQYLVGAFQLGAQLWDRMEAAVLISTEDEDNFQKNLATIRAEERLALTVYRTLSFVTGNFALGGSGS